MTSTEIGHESKTRLLNAALHLIRAKKYSATRIEDICEAASLPQTTLHGVFILAKAKHSREVAAASIDHLRRYLESLFDRRLGTMLQ
jgi:TetR/AcrR family transcriptional repressor of nem operon